MRLTITRCPNPMKKPLSFVLLAPCLLVGQSATATPPTKREILAAKDAALQPATINFRPDDEHYGPNKRMMQGIASIARAPGGRLWATWSGGPAEEGPDN